MTVSVAVDLTNIKELDIAQIGGNPVECAIIPGLDFILVGCRHHKNISDINQMHVVGGLLGFAGNAFISMDYKNEFSCRVYSVDEILTGIAMGERDAQRLRLVDRPLLPSGAIEKMYRFQLRGGSPRPIER